jgi:hypothetical protein
MRRHHLTMLLVAACTAVNACATQGLPSMARRMSIPATRPGGAGMPPGLSFPGTIGNGRKSVEWAKAAVIAALTGGRWLQGCGEPGCPRIQLPDSTRAQFPRQQRALAEHLIAEHLLLEFLYARTDSADCAPARSDTTAMDRRDDSRTRRGRDRECVRDRAEARRALAPFLRSRRRPDDPDRTTQ